MGERPEGADFDADVNGRKVWFRKIDTFQLAMLRKISESDGYVDGVAAMFDVIESLIVSDDDNRYVRREVLAGRFDMKIASKVLAGGREVAQQPDDDADVAPPAAKSTANGRRSKR